MKHFSSVAIALLVTFSSILTEPSLFGRVNRSVFANTSYQVQETTVFVNSDDLREPYQLTIKASSSGAYLSGYIACNGQIIQRLNNRGTPLNLSPYLRQGHNHLSIVGQYSPTVASINVELIGPSNQVSQSTSGSGKLNQSIFLEVQ